MITRRWCSLRFAIDKDFKIWVQYVHTSKKLIEGDYKRVVLFIILGLRGLMIKRGNVKC